MRRARCRWRDVETGDRVCVAGHRWRHRIEAGLQALVLAAVAYAFLVALFTVGGPS